MPPRSSKGTFEAFRISGCMLVGPPLPCGRSVCKASPGFKAKSSRPMAPRNESHSALTQYGTPPDHIPWISGPRAGLEAYHDCCAGKSIRCVGQPACTETKLLEFYMSAIPSAKVRGAERLDAVTCRKITLLLPRPCRDLAS